MQIDIIQKFSPFSDMALQSDDFGPSTNLDDSPPLDHRTLSGGQTWPLALPTAGLSFRPESPFFRCPRSISSPKTSFLLFSQIFKVCAQTNSYSAVSLHELPIFFYFLNSELCSYHNALCWEGFNPRWCMIRYDNEERCPVHQPIMCPNLSTL